jgi:hypothetical protein
MRDPTKEENGGPAPKAVQKELVPEAGAAPEVQAGRVEIALVVDQSLPPYIPTKVLVHRTVFAPDGAVLSKEVLSFSSGEWLPLPEDGRFPGEAILQFPALTHVRGATPPGRPEA